MTELQENHYLMSVLVAYQGCLRSIHAFWEKDPLVRRELIDLDDVHPSLSIPFVKAM